MANILLISVLLFNINFHIYFSLLFNNSSKNNSELFDESITKRVKLYLPEYQNKYSRLNEINDTNFNFSKIRNTRNVLLIPDNIIESYDKVYQREKISNIIDDYINSNSNSDNSNDKDNGHKSKKKNNNYNSNSNIYSDDYTFYAKKESLYYDRHYVWHKYIKPNKSIKEKKTSIIKDIINTEPQELIIENQICSVYSTLLYIINPNNEINLLIKNIKSDIYQIQVFRYPIPKKSKNNNITKSLNISQTVPPKGTFVIQIEALIDTKSIMHGTLYIEFNNKKVLLIPIKIIGKDNQFRVNPIYQIDSQVKKFLSIPIKIFNPSQKIMVIKKVKHSLEKINVLWPDKSSVINNKNLPSSSMFQIQPGSSKNIIYLQYFSAFPSYEFGLIKLKTEDKDIIVIPVLINSVSTPIITYPQYFNFGLCQVTAKDRFNIKKLIPLTLYNKGLDNIKVGKVYIEYDNIFIQFHQNFNGNNIIIAPNEEIKYGYLIFDGNVMEKLENKKKSLIGKLQKGSIYIETNSTDCPLIQVNYSYFPDVGKIEKIISGDIQKLPKHSNKFSFEIKVKYTPPYGLEQMVNFNYGENITILDEKFVKAKIINPLTEEQKYDVNIIFEIDKLDIFHFKRFFYIPIRLTYNLYSFIPIQLDNNDINIVYCGVEDNSKSLASCLRTFGSSNIFDNLKNESHKIINFRFSFGAVCHGVKFQRFLYIVNENSSPVKINEIKSDNDYITLDIEGYEYLGNDDFPSNIEEYKNNSLNENIKYNLNIKNKESKKSTSIILYPKVAIKLSINLFTDINDNMSIKGKNTIIYNNNSKFVIDNQALISKGNINITPINFRFEPAFPGLIQTTYIYCKNSMEFPISLYSVTSNDERIIPSLLTYEIIPDNKTAIIKIIFDPSKTHLFKTFMNAINLNTILTYKELFLWKENEKCWNKLQTMGKTEINTNITLSTSFGKKEINIGSFLIKPSLVKNDIINFGLTQVGKLVSNYIEIFNPSDKVLVVKLVLAPNEYADINNNEMFNIKDQKLLKTNEDIMLLGCSFSGWIGNSIVTNFEYIILQENINPIELRRSLINKNKLIKLLYEYGNQKVKNYLMHGNNVFCRYDKKFKNELINNNNYKNMNVISDLYSKDFEQEIDRIKNMTKKDANSENEKNYSKKDTLWEKISGFFLKIYIKYYLHLSLDTEIEIKKNEQPFYLPNSVYNQIFHISPHQKSTVGPILFRPNKLGNITGTLFLKNNLTILYPLKLHGKGGSGKPSFFPNYQKNQIINSHIFNKTNYIIEVDEYTYINELKEKEKMTRTITIKNTGNLLMDVKNISIDGFGCHTDDMKILQCNEFILYPEESLDIDIEIKPNINNYITNKNIYFNTEYETFNLNIIIFVAKDLYIKNNMIKKHVITMTLILIVFVIFFLLIKTILRLINYKSEKKDNQLNETLTENDKKLTDDKNNNNNIKNQSAVIEKNIKERTKEEIRKKSKNKETNNEGRNKKEKEKGNETEKESQDKNNEDKNGTMNKNKRKKTNKKSNRKTSEISNNSNTDTYSYDKNIKEKEEKKEEKKEIENKETKEKKNIQKAESINSIEDSVQSENIYTTPNKKKKSKKKTMPKPFGMESDSKNDKKNISINDDKSNETDSINEIKNLNTKSSNPPSFPKNINKHRKNSSNLNSNSNIIPGLKEKKQKSNMPKKYYNYYINNNNNVNEEKRQVTTIKLLKNKNIKNLNALFNMTSDKQDKDKKESKKDKKSDKNEKEKIDDDNGNNKINYYYQINANDNKKKEEMNTIFLNDEKRNNAFNLEHGLYKSLKKDNQDNNDLNNLSKIEIECSNSLFNFEGFFYKNDTMNTSRINFRDESVSNEDIKEGEEINNYFNKSLIDKIENPFCAEDKNDQSELMYNKDNSRFFNYDFFNDNNNDD